MEKVSDCFVENGEAFKMFKLGLVAGTAGQKIVDSFKRSFKVGKGNVKHRAKLGASCRRKREIPCGPDDEIHVEWSEDSKFIPLRTTQRGVKLIINSLLLQVEVLKTTIKQLESENKQLERDINKLQEEKYAHIACIKNAMPKVIRGIKVGRGHASGGSGGHSDTQCRQDKTLMGKAGKGGGGQAVSTGTGKKRKKAKSKK